VDNKIIRIHLPPGLHSALKVRAAQESTTMQELIENLISKYLKKGGGK